MVEQAADCGYDILCDRLALLERELEWARIQRDRMRACDLRARIAELRCGCHRLLRAAS